MREIHIFKQSTSISLYTILFLNERDKIIGHLHDGVILLLRPEFFSFFLSHLNLVIPARSK